MMSLATLTLLQQLLGSQQIAVSAPDADIAAVLTAKAELAAAIAALQAPTADQPTAVGGD